MIRIFILALFCIWFYSGIVLPDELKDKQYRSKIIGSWEEGPKASPYGISYFYTGGQYSAETYNNTLKPKLFEKAIGRWWIKDGKLYNVIDLVNPPYIPFQRGPFIDVIVDISKTVMTLIDDKGQKYFKYKLSISA